MPKVSIVIPVHNMQNAKELLARNLMSVLFQTFRDYEIVISDDSVNDDLKKFVKDYPVKYYRNIAKKGMAGNTNYAIGRAKGDLIKILYLDDYFYANDSLNDIVKHLTGNYNWLVTACTHTTGGDHYPYYSESENTIGSPSVLTFKRFVTERFDTQFSWVLDLDLYRRLFRNYGRPKILNKINVVIGIHPGQMTNILTEERKLWEHELLKQKYK